MHDPGARPVIAVDAMGGDHGPGTVVPGALANLTADSHPVDDLPVSVVPCTQDIEMGESPAAAIRNRPDSPIVKAMADQKAGRVQAVVSAGSTGAMVAASLIVLGRLPGVDRPAIATVIPTAGRNVLLLDAGANIQCKPEHLVSFARMGVVYVREMFGVQSPTVGQLNIGGEPGKGPELLTATYALLAASDLDFAGNVEGNEFMMGPCDVVVADGFTGNNTLKLVEGFARFLGALAARENLTDEERAGFRPVLGYLQRNFSYEVAGGAMLLGVDGISIISHGRSSQAAIANAVQVAAQQIRAELPARIAAAHS